jgi:hypothetical protein
MRAEEGFSFIWVYISMTPNINANLKPETLEEKHENRVPLTLAHPLAQSQIDAVLAFPSVGPEPRPRPARPHQTCRKSLNLNVLSGVSLREILALKEVFMKGFSFGGYI